MFTGLEILIDTLVFVSLAIIFGYTIDVLFPAPGDESFIKSLGLIYLQIFLGIVILYTIDSLYLKLTGRNSKTYFGINVYSVLFFLVQKQLGARLIKVFDTLNKYLVDQKVFY